MADMAIHHVIGDSFRVATCVSIFNGGGVAGAKSSTVVSGCCLMEVTMQKED